MRLLLIQFSGDFLEARRRLQETGSEIYYGHRYVLEQLERINSEICPVAIVCCLSSERYTVQLPSGLTLIGASAHAEKEFKQIQPMLDAYNPTHVVILGPLRKSMRWAVDTNRRVACLCADSFNHGALYVLFKNTRIANLFNDARIEWVANHGINACLSLAKIGVDRRKIIPWDWPHTRTPAQLPAKTAPVEGGPTLLFVGALVEHKGLGDAITAVAELKRRGVFVDLVVAGHGDLIRFQNLASRLRISNQIKFLGLVSNELVIALMRNSTAILVPSRHRYPEGLPLTIYEGLSARTPIIASDHPMFARRLKHRESALIYRAGRPEELADRVLELLADPELYGTLSINSEETWNRLQIAVKWADLLEHWLHDGPADRRWFSDHGLDSGLYKDQLSG